MVKILKQETQLNHFSTVLRHCCCCVTSVVSDSGDPIDGSPPGSLVPGILQARTLEWVAISFSNAWKWKVKVKSLNRVQLFATPWTACSLPGSSIHGIFQARVLEWGAIAFSFSTLGCIQKRGKDGMSESIPIWNCWSISHVNCVRIH